MIWTRKLILTQRVLQRQGQSAEVIFDDAERNIRNSCVGCVVVDPDRELMIEDNEPYQMRIPLEKEKEAQERGLFLVESGCTVSVVVNQRQFVVEMLDTDNPREWIAAILEKTGPVFTGLEIRETSLTEVGPL